MASTSRARIWDLPCEVLLSIFSSLPVADLARCAAVCDQWHTVVTSFTLLWKGKAYRSDRGPRECDETLAVMHALPPLQEVTVQSADRFAVYMSFPRLDLSLLLIRVVEDCPAVRCEYLTTTLDIAVYILYHRLFIDFKGLRRLRIQRGPADFTDDYVVHLALTLCPSLRHLSVCTDVMSAEYLERFETFGRLLSFEMECPHLQRLSFLWHCSGRLEELKLTRCDSVPSREFVELRRLQKLRRLWLSDCRFEEGDLAAAVAGLGSLESLQLDGCSSVRDLSLLWHCSRLRELRITSSSAQHPREMLALGRRRLGLHALRLPTATDDRSVRVAGVAVTARDFWTALSRLERMGMAGSCLSYLGALRPCSQMRHVCCEFVRTRDEPEKLNVRVDITLTRSTYR